MAKLTVNINNQAQVDALVGGSTPIAEMGAEVDALKRQVAVLTARVEVLEGEPPPPIEPPPIEPPPIEPPPIEPPPIEPPPIEPPPIEPPPIEPGPPKVVRDQVIAGAGIHRQQQADIRYERCTFTGNVAVHPYDYDDVVCPSNLQLRGVEFVDCVFSGTQLYASNVNGFRVIGCAFIGTMESGIHRIYSNAFGDEAVDFQDLFLEGTRDGGTGLWMRRYGSAKNIVIRNCSISCSIGGNDRGENQPTASLIVFDRVAVLDSRGGIGWGMEPRRVAHWELRDSVIAHGSGSSANAIWDYGLAVTGGSYVYDWPMEEASRALQAALTPQAPSAPGRTPEQAWVAVGGTGALSEALTSPGAIRGKIGPMVDWIRAGMLPAA